MSRLRIHFFGAMDLSREGPLAFPTQKARDLFAFLILHRDRIYPREVLLGIFWGDVPEGVARKRLRTDLWRIRSVLGPGGSPAEQVFLVQGGEVGVNPESDFWLDVAEFEGRLQAVERADREVRSPEAAVLLHQAVSLYRGDLLEGVYEDWCLFERERLRLMYLGALEKLMTHHQERREWEEAIAAGQRLLHTDPFQEHIHRALMRCHLFQGNRPAALRQYAQCEKQLRMDLDVEPMEETVALYEEIKSPAAPPRREQVVELPVAPLEQARRLLEHADRLVADLRMAVTRVESARGLLDQEVHSLEVRGRSAQIHS